jgi:N-acetylmuramoyl-L-alanine amidase
MLLHQNRPCLFHEQAFIMHRRQLLNLILAIAAFAASLQLGSTVLGSLAGITTLHQKRVEQAGFVVLKSLANIPQFGYR